jgi:outer membrane protein, multidrug efflux system
MKPQLFPAAARKNASAGAFRSGASVRLLALPLVLAASALLPGCSVGPNYHPPKTEVSPAFANGQQTNLAPSQTAITWWRGFNDPQLDGLVDRALAANYDLRIATAHVREARALHTQAVADEFPVVTGLAGYNQSLSSADSIPFPLTRSQRELRLFTAGFDATWELDLFGGVRRGIQAASAELGAVQANRQDVMVSVISEVARNYFELRGQQHLLAVARRNAENQRENLELTLARAKGGRGTELDTARARAQLNATLAAIPPLEAAVQHAIYRLGVLTGQAPTALEAVLSPAAPIPALPALTDIGNPADLLRRRPDIRAAERTLAAASARIGVATAEFFPRVTFNGNVGFAAKNFADLGLAGRDTYSFGPNITWAALDLGHIRARLNAARANAEGQLAAYEKTVLLALEETENALVDFGREQARRDYLRQSDLSATAAMDLARQRYAGGLTDFLPVLDAERTQLDIQAQLAASETRTATTLVALYKALGGGWELEAATRLSSAQR